TRAASSAVQAIAVIALGRLADGRAVPALVSLAGSPDAAVRVVALWALGRTAGAGAAEVLRRAAADPRPDAAAVACLGLGRRRDARRDVEALLEALVAPLAAAAPAGEDLETLWTEDIGALEKELGRALEGGGEPRRRALLALDAREGPGLGLGPLAPASPTSP